MDINSYLLANNLTLGKNNIWSKDRMDSFYYSDGEVEENYILEVFKKTKDLSVESTELAQKIHDWASLYYLSSQRSLLLKPFEAQFKGKNILEVGCGCGTITRFLAECGAHVVALEGSSKRAEIARERCRDLDNVSVVSGTTEDLGEKASFDFILLIGVLEYAKKYLGTDGDLQLLNFCKSNLMEDGKLIIAIENKLGAKYIVGAKEDHLFQAMVGVNDAYKKDGVCTYGKNELLTKINDIGLTNQQLFLPFPDYKFPSLIISPLGIRKYQANLIHDLLLQILHKDPQLNNTLYSCSLEGFVSNSCKNFILDDVSNSFLLIASKNKFDYNDNYIAWYYSFFRNNKYKNSIGFREDGGAYVENIKNGEKKYLNESEYNYWNTIFQVINRKNWKIEDIHEWLQGWFNLLVKELNLDDVNFNDKVDFKYIDAMPFNLIQGENSYFIDFEFSDKTSVDLGYLYFRAIFHSLMRVSSFEYSDFINSKKIFDITLKLLNMKFPLVDKKKALDYIAYEVDFLNKSSVVFIDEKELLSKEITIRFIFDYKYNNVKFLFKKLINLAFTKFLKIIS
ncbi:class I SAM-dependent methyltransferase [Acinetobacter indicus]|uniref:class I SAM-dependent methyltransferase n=1 Tax=Acinetobacter indicus TaxID=756892 RepID=UPI00257849C4|nr:class I SAM-dependent methyltransferase [Acinetobacter indicus]MDM1302867.1 class I SAM-dependent methyltransferase [Acinetobacter indicus]